MQVGLGSDADTSTGVPISDKRRVIYNMMKVKKSNNTSVISSWLNSESYGYEVLHDVRDVV